MTDLKHCMVYAKYLSIAATLIGITLNIDDHSCCVNAMNKIHKPIYMRIVRCMTLNFLLKINVLQSVADGRDGSLKYYIDQNYRYSYPC